MRTIRFLLALLLLLPLLASHAAAQGATLSGRVAAEDGTPVRGATVRVTVAGGADRSAVSDAAGRFTVGPLPAGEVRVTASALGYAPASRQTRLAAGGTAEVSLVLTGAAVEVEGVAVTALRTSVAPSTVPGAVTLVGREEIEAQGQVSQNLGDMLGQVVPGLATGTQSMSVFGQALRGRNVAVLIDGIPQSTTRNVSRDLSTIDPEMIERVEVLRGATSVFGDGATGGVINIITRTPAAESTRFTTTVSGETSTAGWSEGLGGRVAQTVTGRRGAFDFVVSGALGETGEYIDADGDVIPSDPHGQGGLAEVRSHDLFGKLGLNSAAGRLQLAVNRFASEQRTDYVSDPAVNGQPAGSVKARPLAGLRLAEDQGTENTMVSLDYSHAELLGSRVHLQGYHRDYRSVFTPFDGRALAAYRTIIQSWLESRKTGARAEVETRARVWGGPTLVWGADYTRESTSQPVHVFDPAVYDQSGGLVFQKIGERPWVPEIQPRSLGAFAQLSLQPFDRLVLRGGVRRERASMDVPDFTTLTGNDVTGGELRFSPTLFNVGAVVEAFDALSLYGSFSQGFSLADVGLALRGASAGAVLGNKEMQAQEVDQYEIGVRGGWRAVEASVAAFRSESELGTTSAGFGQPVVRAPERVYGLEATLDADPTATLGLGGTLSWTEGEYYLERDSAWHALNGWRIQPLKATAYAEHRALDRWSNRLQLLFSGDRERAYEERPNPNTVGFGERAVQSYWVADWISALEIGAGTLDVGVHNLLNRQYFGVASQLLRSGGNTSYTAGRGRTLSLGYTLRY